MNLTVTHFKKHNIVLYAIQWGSYGRGFYSVKFLPIFNFTSHCIWFVSFLTLLGLSELTLQNITFAILLILLPNGIASLIALLPVFFMARVISGFVASIMPKTERSAIRMRFLGGAILEQVQAEAGSITIRAIADAENALSEQIIQMKIDLARLETMPAFMVSD